MRHVSQWRAAMEGTPMTIRLGMYEKSAAHIGPRLDALGLDISLATFDGEGVFTVDGAQAAAGDVSLDYLWFSVHLPRDGKQSMAFDLALACKRVDVLQTFNAGLDNPVYAKIAAKGARICNSSAQGVAISEYVIAQVMGAFHPLARLAERQKDKIWRVAPFREISRTTWLIVGFGPIGQALAQRVAGFEARVTAIRRSGAPGANVDRMGGMGDLNALAAEADVVVFACPLNAETRDLAGPDFFAALKPGATLVNIARGGVIDSAALLEALENGKVDTAILDVFPTEPLPEDDPFWTHPKVRVTPHTSFAGDGVQARWDQLFLDNIQRYAKGEALIREVDPTTL